MKIVIIGAVAAGTSAAAKARRNSEKHEIVVYDKDSDISYSGCGLPYYIEDESISRIKITPRSAQWFWDRFRIQIHIRHEVLSIHPQKKQIRVKNLLNGEILTDSYDRLILATGSLPAKPSIPGLDSPKVTTLKNPRHADQIKKRVQSGEVKTALIVGGGMIGLEMAESLTVQGVQVTLAETASQVLPFLSSELALLLEDHLREKGVILKLGTSVEKIEENGTVRFSDGKNLIPDLILLACGVKPNTELAVRAGIRLGRTGAILINRKMETSVKHIYAAGDCAQNFCLITGRPVYRPMGSTANKMGRLAGDLLTGGKTAFRGILGTAILKCFDLTVARTGLSESEAREAGYRVEVLHLIKPNISEVLPQSREMTLKVTADRKRGRVLGAEIIGGEGVDKRLDVLATALSLGARVSDLFHLDLGYAPPYSTTKDPVSYAGMILSGAIFRRRRLITAEKLIRKREAYQVVDVRDEKDFEREHIPGAIHLPLPQLRERFLEISSQKRTVVHCNKGTTGNAAQNLLINLGFKKVYNLSGGFQQYLRVREALKKKG